MARLHDWLRSPWRSFVMAWALLAGLLDAGSARAADPENYLLFTESASLATEPAWSVTGLAGASAGDDKLIWLLSAPWSADLRDDYFAGLTASRRIARYGNFTLEGELGVGFRFGVTDGVEGWTALFLRYELPWDQYLRTTLGASTGLNWMSELPPAEVAPGGEPEEFTSHVLHYLAPEVAFALPNFPNRELVVRLHHRSGVFGLFNGVKGGSNVITVGGRVRF